MHIMETERRQHIVAQILKVLEESGCTAAEAFEVLDFTKETVMVTAKVNADWPKSN